MAPHSFSPPPPVKLFAAVLAAGDAFWEELESELERAFGEIDSSTRALPWSESPYYEREMGGDLVRRFYSFARLRSPGELVEDKHGARSIEDAHRDARTRGRRINIDPGYLEAGKIVLASTKNANHRIYLGSGIYAEATLAYVGGVFVPYGYTYPDYQWPETLEFFGRVRKRYLEERRRDHRTTGPPDH